MEFDYNLAIQHPIGGSNVEQFHALLAQARAAKRYGFDSISTGQHWLSTPSKNFQLVPTLGRAIAEAEGLQVHNVFLLPFHNPVALAKEVATLDIPETLPLRVHRLDDTRALWYYHATQRARQSSVERSRHGRLISRPKAAQLSSAGGLCSEIEIVAVVTFVLESPRRPWRSCPPML